MMLKSVQRYPLFVTALLTIANVALMGACGKSDQPADDGSQTSPTPNPLVTKPDVIMAQASFFKPNPLRIYFEVGDVVPIKDPNIYQPVCGRADSIGTSFTDKNGMRWDLTPRPHPYPDVNFELNNKVDATIHDAWVATKSFIINSQEMKTIRDINFTITNATQWDLPDSLVSGGAAANRLSFCTSRIQTWLGMGYDVQTVELLISGDMTFDITFKDEVSEGEFDATLGSLSGYLAIDVKTKTKTGKHTMSVKGSNVRWGVLTAAAAQMN